VTVTVSLKCGFCKVFKNLEIWNFEGFLGFKKNLKNLGYLKTHLYSRACYLLRVTVASY